MRKAPVLAAAGLAAGYLLLPDGVIEAPRGYLRALFSRGGNYPTTEAKGGAGDVLRLDDGTIQKPAQPTTERKPEIPSRKSESFGTRDFTTHNDPTIGYKQFLKRNGYGDKDFFKKQEEKLLIVYSKIRGHIAENWRHGMAYIGPTFQDADVPFDSVVFIGEESRQLTINDIDNELQVRIRFAGFPYTISDIENEINVRVCFEGFRYTLKAAPAIQEIRGIYRDPRDELKPSVLKDLEKVPEMEIVLWFPFIEGVDDREGWMSFIFSRTDNTGILDRYVIDARGTVKALIDSALSDSAKRQ